MRAEDMYPSTFDAVGRPPIAGAQEDLTLDTLVYARRRVDEDWTAERYVTKTGSVCAYGGILVAPTAMAFYEGVTDDGLRMKQLDARLTDLEVGLIFEQSGTDAAREAIKLLNEAALELYPAAAEWAESNWMGPIEWLNQESFEGEDPDDWEDEPDPRKVRVLEAYDRAIAKREGALV